MSILTLWVASAIFRFRFNSRSTACTSFTLETLARCAWNVDLRSVNGSPWIISGATQSSTRSSRLISFDCRPDSACSAIETEISSNNSRALSISSYRIHCWRKVERINASICASISSRASPRMVGAISVQIGGSFNGYSSGNAMDTEALRSFDMRMVNRRPPSSKKAKSSRKCWL